MVMKRKLFLPLAAALLFYHARAQQLTSAEYFFDSDPGVGNGTSLSVSAGDSILFAGNISTSGLSDGFHFLYLRAKDDNGVWSISERRSFYISSLAPVATLGAAEYFFDSDPGVGNGTPLSV